MARCTVVCVKLPVGFQACEPLQVPHGKEVAELRSDTAHPRLERTDLVTRSAVAAHLVVKVAGDAHEQILGQELRCARVQVSVHAVLMISFFVFEIVGESRYGREFASVRRIQVFETRPTIDGAVSNADASESGGGVGPDRNISSPVYMRLWTPQFHFNEASG